MTEDAKVSAVPESCSQQHPTKALSATRKDFSPKILGHLQPFRGHDGRDYVLVTDTPNPHVIEIGSAQLDSLLRARAFAEGTVLRKSNLDDIILILKAQAQQHGNVESVRNRVAPIDGGIEIDLGNDQHTRVRITADGVKVVDRGSDVRFRRTPNMRPLPIPQLGSATADVGLAQLRVKKYLANVHPTQQMLLIAWLTYTIALPKIPTSVFVILVLLGTSGVGKSTACKMLTSIVDPTNVDVQPIPGNIKDLAIALQNSHLPGFDNLRQITPEKADILCIAATGGCLSSRQLYTDSDIATVQLHGAMILNGIHTFIDQPDLAQRCLQIELKPLDETHRKSKQSLWHEFETDLPVILGELYGLIARIFACMSKAQVTNPERLIEFVEWLAALEVAEDNRAGTFQAVYSDRLNAGQLETLLDNSLAAAVVEFAQKLNSVTWTGTPAECLEELERYTNTRTQRSKEWPLNPIALSKRLKPLQAGLKSQGIEVIFGRGKHRTITISVEGGLN